DLLYVRMMLKPYPRRSRPSSARCTQYSVTTPNTRKSGMEPPLDFCEAASRERSGSVLELSKTSSVFFFQENLLIRGEIVGKNKILPIGDDELAGGACFGNQLCSRCALHAMNRPLTKRASTRRVSTR